MLEARTSTEEILAQLIAFDTTSRNTNLPLIDFVRHYLQASWRCLDVDPQ